MKRLLIIPLIFISILLNAQKRELNSALHLLSDEYHKEAYECVKRAEAHEKTKTYYKTYMYKFKCIIEMYRKNDTAMLNSLVNPLDTAYDALMKSMCYNFHDPKIKYLDYNSTEGLKTLHDNIGIALKAPIPEVEDISNLIRDYFRRVPYLAGLYFGCAQEYKFHGYMDSAYSACVKSIQISEFNEFIDAQAYAFAADIMFSQHKYNETITYLNQVIKKDYGSDDAEKSKYFANLAESYLKTGDTVKYLATARSNAFKHKQVAHNENKKLLNFCIQNNYPELMLESLELLESIASDYIGIYELKGELFKSQKEYDKALNNFRQYQDLNKEDFNANYLMADCLMDFANENVSLKDSLNSEALIYLRKAKSINPYVSYVNQDIERIESELQK